jgi:hypothetical protein
LDRNVLPNHHKSLHFHCHVIANCSRTSALGVCLYVGCDDIALSSSLVRIPSGQQGSVSFTFIFDGVAQEEDETFSLSISRSSLSTLYSVLGNDTRIVDVMNGVIKDSNSKHLSSFPLAISAWSLLGPVGF